MERQDRDRRKEEERLMREKQREEERSRREQRREMERREKFLQKECLRVCLGASYCVSFFVYCLLFPLPQYPALWAPTLIF